MPPGSCWERTGGVGPGGGKGKGRKENRLMMGVGEGAGVASERISPVCWRVQIIFIYVLNTVTILEFFTRSQHTESRFAFRMECTQRGQHHSRTACNHTP